MNDPVAEGSNELDNRPAPTALFRVARRPAVWTWTDLKYVGQGRWDDPEHQYAVLYASGSAFGAYVESLSTFQPDLELAAQLQLVRRNARGLRITEPAGRVPARWRSQRLLGRGAPEGLGGAFVAVGAAATLATLRRELADVALELGVAEIDAGVIRLDYSPEFRAFTQAISRFVYRRDEEPAGIFYLGQHGDDVENYAIFQRSLECPVRELSQTSIVLSDEPFLRACAVLGIEPA